MVRAADGPPILDEKTQLWALPACTLNSTCEYGLYNFNQASSIFLYVSDFLRSCKRRFVLCFAVGRAYVRVATANNRGHLRDDHLELDDKSRPGSNQLSFRWREIKANIFTSDRRLQPATTTFSSICAFLAAT